MLVTSLRGVGPHIAEWLAKLNIYTVQDLLFHLPLHYQDRTEITPIASLRAGDQKLIEGTIQLGQTIYHRRRNLICRLADKSGHIILHLYHFNKIQQQQLTTPGTRLRCFGTVRYNRQQSLEMIHPEYKVITGDEPFKTDNYLTPVYPTTKGLSQYTLKKIITQALLLLQQQTVTEILPENLRQQFNLATLHESIFFLHRPPKNISLTELENRQHPLQQRLAFEELLAQQVAAQQYRQRMQQYRAPILADNDFQMMLQASLPFTLTSAQQRVREEINTDLAKSTPMMRLLQGDVGSGKTIVAVMAILRAVKPGLQAVVMAPTELLAEQHFIVLQRWLNPLSIKVGWLSGHLTRAVREHTLQQIMHNHYAVIVGTHALFQADVRFANLALVVIDEQHRFGVHQRLALKEKGVIDGYHPHQLMMTATPIPRTLAMTAYADLDVSVIDELPAGRKPVQTTLISNERREALIDRIKQNCKQGRQVYWVCTVITDSDVLACEAAEVTYALLKNKLSHLRIGLLHGRLNREVKEMTMESFKIGKIDLLVATTIIEVGMDVPNASLMVIENPERLGLSQLHQLRGRVGRGGYESHCVLLYQKPLSALAKARLMILRDSTDGFVIAQKDLEMRGPGEWLGTQQAGLPELRVADIVRDQPMLLAIKQMTELIMQQSPEIGAQLIARWLRNCEQYASV